MKLDKYYKMQAVLDQNIIEKKNLNISDRELFSKRVIAFKQEFGELLQRLPKVFKYWSNKENILDEETLEEWVDGFHFLLSIGNLKGWQTNDVMFLEGFEGGLDELAICIYENTFFGARNYYQVFDQYYTFIRTLGYTDDQIEVHYKLKNKVNFKRQENNY